MPSRSGSRAQHGQGVAGVHGQGGAVQAVQGRQPAPLAAAVLDAVVDQEGVVGELDGHRRP
jgi:hypothetical protein